MHLMTKAYMKFNILYFRHISLIDLRLSQLCVGTFSSDYRNQNYIEKNSVLAHSHKIIELCNYIEKSSALTHSHQIIEIRNYIKKALRWHILIRLSSFPRILRWAGRYFIRKRRFQTSLGEDSKLQNFIGFCLVSDVSNS